MDPIWLKHYPSAISHTIDPDSYSSLNVIFHEAFEKYAKRVAYTNMGTHLTYEAVQKKARDFSAFLQNVCHLKKGDRIAIMLPNVLQYPVAVFAALQAGLIVVNVNPLYTARELQFQLMDSGAETIIVLANFAHTVESVLSETKLKHVIVTEIGDMLSWPKSLLVNTIIKHVKKMVPAYQLNIKIDFNEALKKGKTLPFTEPEIVGSDLAFLQYTGGTTGVAKGAMLSHRNIISNILQAHAWLKPCLASEAEVIVTALPLYHIFALTANFFVFFHEGAKNILITNPRDFSGFIKQIKNAKFTAITGVNTLFNALLNHPDFETVDFSHLHLTLGGGMAVQQAVAEKWKAVTGRTLTEAYGLTETSPAVCINLLDSDEFSGCIGFPLPSTEILICDDAGQALGIDQIGELCVRGPQVMKGYWNRPDETEKSLNSEGWFKTGDIVVVNEKGMIKLVDRKKDMILVSGFNVYPNEIEDVIALHPGVKEVAVIGVPYEKTGERVRAYIVKKDESLTEAAMMDFCKENLTGYKVPKEFVFRDELPKTNVGKILRRVLRNQAVLEK